MNKRRLLKLADLLEADAANKRGVKFDIGTWGCSSDVIPAPDCGTTACAMGLAALSGAFRRAGLEGRWAGDALGEKRLEITFKGRGSPRAAAMCVFEISNEDASFLFMPSAYEGYGLGSLPSGAKGERIVAKRIRDFVAGKVSA